MAIFNSLGSNYSARFVLKSLLGRRQSTAAELVTILGEHYGGQVTLTYKGREALELALNHSHLQPGSHVAVNGFTCYAVYKAVANAGYETVYLDVAAKSLHFDVAELRKAHTQHPDLGAVVVQNTLGLSLDIAPIEEYCRKHELLLIEDLAHSLGMHYTDGREAGMVGDMVMLSFSQDKGLDVVAGGALIDRRPNAVDDNQLPKIGWWQRAKNHWYPFWASLIRWTYPIGLGRYIHFGLKQLHLLATPMSDDLEGLHQMTPQAASLLTERWAQRENEFKHRRSIAAIYQKTLPKDMQLANPSPDGSVYLRFSLLVDDRPGLIAYLKTQSVYVGDTWYDAPVGPAKYLSRSNYRAGECPQAEKVAMHIVNLPTHINISEAQAEALAKKVATWLASA